MVTQCDCAKLQYCEHLTGLLLVDLRFPLTRIKQIFVCHMFH